VAERQEPQKYGKCLIEREIGRGARSIVYLAWHEGLQIPVAVKVMKKAATADDEHFSERFMREARIAAQLTHSNIVRVYDCGETSDSYYLVLEYIEGESCKDRMARRGAFDWESAVRIIRQVADGLNHAARKGIIHRDLKPENIMIDEEGSPRIADLGLAKEVAPGRASATSEGDVLGTPYYMSPEQVRQPGSVDFRSDVYSLGATLYHMATGEVPFEAATPFEIMTMHLNEPLTPPQQRRSDLPQPLCDIIVRAMAKKAEDRYQSYGDLMLDLDKLLAAAPQARDAFMTPVEETLNEVISEPEPAAPPTSPQPAPPRAPAPPRPLRPAELPVTARQVPAKLWGMLALLTYALLAVCVNQAFLAWAGPAAGWAAVAALLAAAAASALRSVRGPAAAAEAESPNAVDLRIGVALGWACARLDLPTPRLTVSPRKDHKWYAYTFFSRRGALEVPVGWLGQVGLKDDEVRAFITAALADVYSGNADFRTLLALPVSALAACERGLRRLLMRGKGGAAQRLRSAHALTVLIMGAVCVAVAGLAVLSPWAGILAGALLALLLSASAFEREAVHAADAFALQVLGQRQALTSLLAAMGLTSLERHRLLMDTLGPDVAQRLSHELAPEETAQVAPTIVEHYTEFPYTPGTVETARKLLAGLPSAAERISRLSGYGVAGPAAGALDAAKRAYGRLLGVREGPAMSLAELAATKLYAATGAAGGAMALLALGVLFLSTGGTYAEFLVVLATLSAAMGGLVAARVARDPVTPGRMGWAQAVASLFFALTAMAGLALTGWQRLVRLAVQFPVFLPLVLAMAAGVGALIVRFGPKLGLRLRGAGMDVRGETWPTLMIQGQAEAPAARPDEGVPQPPTRQGRPNDDA
jgi:serine/threonine-protein kinase